MTTGKTITCVKVCTPQPHIKALMSIKPSPSVIVITLALTNMIFFSSFEAIKKRTTTGSTQQT